MQVRNSVGRPEYAALYNKLFQDFNSWQNELNVLREEAMPSLQEELVDQPEKAALAEQAKRIDQLFEWKTTEFPNMIQDLPTP
jgi:hypothetical protein